MNALRLLAGAAVVGFGVFALYETVERADSGVFTPVAVRGPHVPGAPRVALTFDDGPDPHRTPALLAVLQARKVPATFFVVGDAAASAPEVVRAMYAGGNEIENHSRRHAHLNAMTAGAQEHDLQATNATLQGLGIPKPRYVRPPYGARNAATLQAARAAGLRVVLWSASLLDRPHDPGTLRREADALARTARDGEIVLLHDGDSGRGDGGGLSSEAEVVPRLVDALRARGFRFVTLAQLLDQA